MRAPPPKPSRVWARPDVRRVGRIAVLASIASLMAPMAAFAHPLGNFSIDHYSRLTVSHDGLRVRFVIDMADIPAAAALDRKSVV